MANADGNDWQNWASVAWEFIKYVLAALGAVASSAVLWMTKSYQGRVAMLLRHEEWIKHEDDRRGEQKAFVEAVKKGPIGEELVEVIDEQKRENLKIHKRINMRRKENAAVREDVREMKTDLRWIRETLEQMKDK